MRVRGHRFEEVIPCSYITVLPMYRIIYFEEYILYLNIF
ncbi:hypothetical protein OIU79_026497 [Salix purpurea]|uniref:Uncharacterized protein n=1 Tax=Salix purpurea TaxID=77065 RepID=A0A9Q1A0Q8_SALPP|nr:hypothetical protein OIU79_026497 [Salix purpurea]